MAAVLRAARRSRDSHRPRCLRDGCLIAESLALFVFPLLALVDARNACLQTSHMVRPRPPSLGSGFERVEMQATGPNNDG